MTYGQLSNSTGIWRNFFDKKCSIHLRNSSPLLSEKIIDPSRTVLINAAVKIEVVETRDRVYLPNPVVAVVSKIAVILDFQWKLIPLGFSQRLILLN
jgi:hypothetical protein